MTDEFKDLRQPVESPFGSDFGQSRPYDFDTIGFSESELRVIENAQMDAAASSQVARAVYAGVPLSQAVREGSVKEENGVYRFGNCKVSVKGSPIVAFDSCGGDFIMTKATGQCLTVENSQIDDVDILFDADITIKNSQLRGKTKVMSRIIDDEFYQYNETATIEDSYVLDSKIDASRVKQSRVIDSEMGHSTLEKAVLVNSGIDHSTIKDAMVEKCGMINSDVIRVGCVKDTAMFVSVVKDALSINKSQVDYSNIVNSGRLEYVDAYDVSVENVTESNVQLRSDDANKLVVTVLTAEDSEEIDESQFNMGSQKGLQQ